ncbi:MAG: DUF1553 domain-containing protein, partial [Planctomycetota bacterium]
TGPLPGGVAPPGTTRSSRRVAFSRWLTSPENPWFDRALVNWVWAQLFGAGLVEPVDDLDAAASSPYAALLEGLAADFVAAGRSLRWLLGTLARTRAYQRSSAGAGEDLADARRLFGAARVRPLPPDVAARALLRAAGRAEPGPGELPGLHRALRRRLAAALARAFAAAEGDGEAEAALPATPTAAAVFLLNGREPTGLVRGPALRALLAREPDPAARVRALFERTLCRAPRPSEARAVVALLAARGHDRTAYEDLFWALLASSEFLSNH